MINQGHRLIKALMKLSREDCMNFDVKWNDEFNKKLKYRGAPTANPPMEVSRRHHVGPGPLFGCQRPKRRPRQAMYGFREAPAHR